MLAQLRSMSVSSSPTELQIPATTRGAGLVVEKVFNEAAAVTQRAVEQSQARPVDLYRVTLSQVAAQQQLAKTKMSAMQDEVIAPHQLEFVTADFLQEILSTSRTYALIGTVPSAFGKLDENGVEYRTFIPPHPTRLVERPHPAPTSDEPSPSRRALALEVPIVIPNPFFVTIQNLNDTVNLLAGDNVPPADRAFFRAHNPIPEVEWDEQNRITNARYLCVPDYPNSEMFRTDVDRYRRFVSHTCLKLGLPIIDLPFDGVASKAMFVTEMHFGGSVNNPPRGQVFRASCPLSEREMVLGSIPLVGEIPSEPPSIPGFGFREPTSSCRSYEFNWSALIDSLLVKK